MMIVGVKDLIVMKKYIYLCIMIKRDYYDTKKKDRKLNKIKIWYK